MNRIDNLFKTKQNSVLSVYFTAGYPELNDTGLIIWGLEKAGADLIEIGFPFSDPVADGPVIQASSHRALQNGMNLDILFGQLREIREESHIPKILMGYFNTVYQYQVDRFIRECVDCGIDGVIIPDLPPEVYDREYRESFQSAGIHFICLVAPQTTPERAAWLTSLSSGFIYRLSSSSTTGSDVSQDLSVLSAGAAEPVNTHLPTLIGFGIHDHETFEIACSQANGAIIGTGFIRFLDARTGTQGTRQSQMEEVCTEFVRTIRG
jgi:tryptophan synthase alpha chain